MNGADYIDFAAKIAVTYSDAASCRSVISRAYYGAFHLARSLLERIGSRPPRNANAHVFTQHRLMNCGHAGAVEAGQLLRDLYADRLNADYSLERRQVENVGYARAGVATARRIQTLIEACDQDEGWQQIVTGIADYERRISGK
jgi:uncharacterized protein (UPF0332 family)